MTTLIQPLAEAPLPEYRLFVRDETIEVRQIHQ